MSHSANKPGPSSSAFIANNASERYETTLRVPPDLRLTSTAAPPPLNLGDLAALSSRPLQCSDATQKRKEPQHYVTATAPSPNHATAHAVNNSTPISHNFAPRIPSDEIQANASTPSESEATRRNTGRRTGRGNGQGGRNPSEKNFTSTKIEQILRIVGKHKPLGAHLWALVHEGYAQWAGSQGFPLRDANKIKSKFDRLAHTQKPSENLKCPIEVRQAIQIARSILKRAHLFWGWLQL